MATPEINPHPIAGSTAPNTAVKIKEINGFELLERVGQGGMGTVFKARQKSLDRIVAVKLLPPSIAKNQTLIERFQREARASAKLTHANIVQGIDVGQDAATGLWYFAMEYVDGPTLQQLIKEQKCLPETRALELVREIARALVHVAEHGMVHRDIKPDNIILDSRGTPKLADLGLARTTADDASLTLHGQAVGTPSYMSPEQIRGLEDDIDIRTDLYALGATLFHLVIGQPPFSGPSSAVVMSKHLSTKPPLACEINPEVSGACSQVIARLLEKERSRRIQTPAELIRQIDLILTGDKSPTASFSKVTSGASGRGGAIGNRQSGTRSTGPLSPTLRRSGETASTGPFSPIDTAATASQQPVAPALPPLQASKTGTRTRRGWIAAATALIAFIAAWVFSSQTPTHETVEALSEPVPSALPQPGTPPPPPAVPALPRLQPPDKEARAQAALAAALEVQRRTPGDFSAILDALGQAQAQASGTAVAQNTAEAFSAAQRQWSEALTEALNGLRDAAGALAAKDDFTGALDKLRDAEVPENLRAADWRTRLAPLRENIHAAAATAADKIIDAATARAQANTVAELQAALEQLKRLDSFPPVAPAKARAGELREAWLAALNKLKKDAEAARQARALKAQGSMAGIEKELELCLQQNRFAAANEMLDRCLGDASLAEFAARLQQAKADVAALATRQTARLASPAAAAPETRKPVPASAALAAAEKVLRQTLKLESAKPAPAELCAAAEKVLTQARSVDDLPLRYVMLRDASTLAAVGGDIGLAFAALDELSALFAVDAVSIKTEALTRANAVATTPAALQPLIAAAAKLVETAVSVENFDAALRLSSFAEDAARRAREPRLAATSQLRTQQLREMQTEFAKVKSARLTLRAKPSDPDALLVIGRFLCVHKRDWASALPLLAQASDAPLRALTEQDLAAPAEATAQAALADGYWEWSVTQSAATRASFRLRAAEWYAKCLGTLVGPARDRAEERIKSVAESAGFEAGNLALASSGATVTGPSAPNLLIDGVVTGYTGGSGFAYGTCPCEFVITLSKVYMLREIRLLLWDGDNRWYNYAIEVSADGKTFATLSDRSKGQWRSWQVIPLAQPVRVIKLKGLHDSANAYFHAVELEAYCQPPATRPVPKYPSEEK